MRSMTESICTASDGWKDSYDGDAIGWDEEFGYAPDDWYDDSGYTPDEWGDDWEYGPESISGEWDDYFEHLTDDWDGSEFGDDDWGECFEMGAGDVIVIERKGIPRKSKRVKE